MNIAPYLCFIFLVFGALPNIYAKELPVESFSQLPRFSAPTLSPDGKRIAYLRNYQSPEVSVLTTVDLSTGKKQLVVQSDNEEIKTNWFEWANNKSLIVSLRFASKRGSTDTIETRLMVIDVDGEKPEQRQLLKPRIGRIGKDNLSQIQDNLVSFLPDDPEHILIALDLDVPNLPDVYKLNIYSGARSLVLRGKMKVRDWMSDRQGNIRLGQSLSYKTGEASTRIRIGDQDEWHEFFAYNAFEDPEITPLGFAKDPNILYYSKYKGDKKALFKIDLATRESRLVFEDPDYDVNGSLIYSAKTNDVVGISHANSRLGRVYWYKPSENFHISLSKALPDQDVYITDFSQDENVYLVFVENDYTPGEYFLGNRKNKSLTPILVQYPNLIPEVLSEHKLVTYTARDGTEIEAYLTLPLNTDRPVAAILLPHGGPGARDYGGFDYWTSFFANRGYAVFRPNFRGSEGYGFEFAQSQMRSWGLSMQDDLSDAAKWLADKNIALKEKICIVGASYGGYAAAMAAVKTPDLFQCAISFAGVTDLKKLVSNSRRYLNSKFVKNQIGDDSDDLEKRSPAYNANKMNIPMLFIHGEDDRVVDVNHSRAMVKALQDLNKSVEYIELKNGDHYLSIQRNRHITFNAMDAFLKQYLSE